VNNQEFTSSSFFALQGEGSDIDCCGSKPWGTDRRLGVYWGVHRDETVGLPGAKPPLLLFRGDKARNQVSDGCKTLGHPSACSDHWKQNPMRTWQSPAHALWPAGGTKPGNPLVPRPQALSGFREGDRGRQGSESWKGCILEDV
jgi:hypothetical protein